MRSARLHVLLLSVLALLLAGTISPVSASAAPFCGIHWGSLAKQGTLAGTGPAILTDIRAGRHGCYDRLVLDLRSQGTAHPATTWRVEYVPQLPFGEWDVPLPMRGRAILSIRIRAYTHDPLTGPVYNSVSRDPRELVDVSGYRTFRQLELAQDFEDPEGCEPSDARCPTLVFGLGVRARLPFRVFTLAGSPSSSHGARLVIDVAHSW